MRYARSSSVSASDRDSTASRKSAILPRQLRDFLSPGEGDVAPATTRHAGKKRKRKRIRTDRLADKVPVGGQYV